MTTQTTLRKAATGTRVTVTARPWIKFARVEDGTWLEVARMGHRPLNLSTGDLFQIGVTIDEGVEG
jgi:hypothetical protein